MQDNKMKVGIFPGKVIIVAGGKLSTYWAPILGALARFVKAWECDFYALYK